MIDFETFHRMRRLRDEEKLSPEQIAERLGLNVKTVRRWLAKRRYEPRRKQPGGARGGKLAPYKDLIIAWLEEFPYTGAQLLHRLRADHGYTGSRSILNAYIATVRPSREKAYLRLHFEPGDCAQIDWGTHGVLPVCGSPRKLHFFAAVLCHSRQIYVEFFLGQSMECFLAAHRNAFQFFEGSTVRVMHDNMKTAVLARPPGEAPRFNPRYLDFAAYYGFKPVPCNVRSGNEKGRVENLVGYVKKNFLAGRKISSLAALNIEARQWMDEVANVRDHGTTRKRPCDLHIEEKPRLQPLPLLPYDIAVTRRARATNRCQVHFESNRYSVPFAHAGALVELRIDPEALSIHRGHELIAQHPRHYGRDRDIDNPDHTSQLLKERKRGEDAALMARFLSLSHLAEDYLNQLRDRTPRPMTHVRRILMLAATHGVEAVGNVMEEALELGAFGGDYIQNILEFRQSPAPPFGELCLTHGREHLAIAIPPPDCSAYTVPEAEPDHPTQGAGGAEGTPPPDQPAATPAAIEPPLSASSTRTLENDHSTQQTS